ncbi:MAG: hypothetical protein ACRDPE_15785 [Solirubrobacterales bacterium]
MAVQTVLDQARELLERRLGEIDAERVKLERAMGELGGKAKKRGRGPGRPKGAGSTSNGAAPKKRRKRRGGTRSDQAVEFVKANPGASASAIAAALKIKPNYMYRVLGDLAKEGRVKKDGTKYTAV